MNSPANATQFTSRTPEECAQAQLDAYNGHDISAFAEVYADDIQLIDLPSGTPFCVGRSSLIERYGALFANHPDLHCTLVSRIVAPPYVIDEEHVRGISEHIIHAVATYEVHDGKIQRAWFLREHLPA